MTRIASVFYFHLALHSAFIQLPAFGVCRQSNDWVMVILDFCLRLLSSSFVSSFVFYLLLFYTAAQRYP